MGVPDARIPAIRVRIIPIVVVDADDVFPYQGFDGALSMVPDIERGVISDIARAVPSEAEANEERRDSDGLERAPGAMPPIVGGAEAIVVGAGGLTGAGHSPGGLSALIDGARFCEPGGGSLLQDVNLCQGYGVPGDGVGVVLVTVIDGIEDGCVGCGRVVLDH